jgi:carboxyl-terminal processing protease
MRWILTMVVVMGCGAGAVFLAAPASVDGPIEKSPPEMTPPAKPRDTSEQHPRLRELDPERARAIKDSQDADKVVFAIKLVEEKYIRRVNRAELTASALMGLYDAARRPMPASLQAEVRKAATDDELFGLIRWVVYPTLKDSEHLRDLDWPLICCRAMVKSLDPYSAVLTGDELRRTSGREDNYGVGLELEDNGGVGSIPIRMVLPGGPAQKAGLRPGDRITAIDGKQMKNVDRFQALVLLNSGEQKVASTAAGGDIELVGGFTAGTTVDITVQREGAKKERKITLQRGEFQAESVYGVMRRDDNSWDYWLDRKRKIAQVRIGPIGSNTADELREVLKKLKADGLRGLLLDLRWCPGGLLQPSLQVAQMFLGRCTVATVKGRADKPEKLTTEDGKILDVHMVVLVNGETSGGGELIAAALQDHKRAAIAGQRTRGKANIQNLLPLPSNGAGLRLTTAVFIRPSGKNLHRFPDSKPRDDWGVQPDPKLESRISPMLSQRLRDWWQQQTLRPGSDRTILPLDDPIADPQRNAAVAALQAKLK